MQQDFPHSFGRERERSPIYERKVCAPVCFLLACVRARESVVFFREKKEEENKLHFCRFFSFFPFFFFFFFALAGSSYFNPIVPAVFALFCVRGRRKTWSYLDIYDGLSNKAPFFFLSFSFLFRFASGLTAA